MCGIAGFTGTGNEHDGRRMIESIRYRGPDFTDVWFTENICLAHARLSIIDLSTSANQPMFSNDKSLAIVFNGEIYNFKEIKAELEQLNKYSFKTHSDTEVLLYLYKEYGEKMFDKLNGMFAFAIYDFTSQTLFAARDRMGKKPFYFSQSPGCFVFGSEIKSVLAHPAIRRELNHDVLNQYLTFDYVPTPRSIIKNINKLQPGHFMVVKNNRIVKNQAYWKSDFTINHSLPFIDAIMQFDKLLNDAVLCRMISDVPLGVFLSGGIDSSTIAYYAQKNSAKKVKTFSIGFEDKSYDEKDYALQVANHIGSEHYSSVLTPRHSLELIEEIYPHCDEPFADASLIPTYYLSKFTRQQVTVSLGGDGSDELLAGYPTFISQKFTFPLKHFPKQVINFLMACANALPASDKNISLDFKIKQFLRGFVSSQKHIHQLWLGSFIPDEKKKLFTPDFYNSLADKTGLALIDKLLNETNAAALQKITHFYYQTYLLDDILVKVDRASMYNSLEVRAPFLDKNVVEFVNTLPFNARQKGMQGKYILKKLMEGKLPHNIIYRPKKGFGIPLSHWLRHDLKPLCEDLLSKENIDAGKIFNYSFIHRLKTEHYQQKNNHRKLLWNLMMFEMWKKNYLP